MKKVLRCSNLLFISSLFFIIVFWNFIEHSNYVSIKCEQICRYLTNIENDQVKFDSSSSVRHFPEFICPQNFRNLADWIFGWPNQFFENIQNPIQDAKLIGKCLSPGSIIYVRVNALDEFFQRIYPNLIHNFVLITGEGDLSSPTHLSFLDETHSKIIHWFGQNGQIHSEENKKFTHIPIGINCFEMADAIRSIQKQTFPRLTIRSVHPFSNEPLNFIFPLDVTQRILSNSSFHENHLALINFDPNTDGTGLRSRIWSQFCRTNQSNSFIKCIEKTKGVQIFKLKDIYQRNRLYPFWISPRGNGIDCHRTWEALYLDIIPVVWNSTLNVLYENLPIVIINRHEDLNRLFLLKQFNSITMRKRLQRQNSSFHNRFHFEKLQNSYWRRIILNKSKYSKTVGNLINQRKCWKGKSSILEWTRYLFFLKYF